MIEAVFGVLKIVALSTSKHRGKLIVCCDATLLINLLAKHFKIVSCDLSE